MSILWLYIFVFEIKNKHGSVFEFFKILFKTHSLKQFINNLSRTKFEFFKLYLICVKPSNNTTK